MTNRMPGSWVGYLESSPCPDLWTWCSQGNIGPDGVDMDEERRWEEKFAAEMELEMAEKAVEAGEQVGCHLWLHC